MTLNRVTDFGLNSQQVANNTSSLAAIAYNVKSYGAKGDGTTDDTTAILNAINDAKTNGGTVFFPKGTYVLSSSIVLGNNVTIELLGNSSTNTTINYTGNGWTIDSSANSFANYSTLKIKGMTINIPATCSGGINGNYTVPHLDDVIILGPNGGTSSGTGIYIGPIANIAEVDWGKVWVSTCTKGVILNSDHVSIRHLQLFNNTTQLELGAASSQPTGISIQYLHCDSTLDSNPGKAIHLAGAANVYMSCVHLEGPYSPYFSIETSPGRMSSTVIESLTYTVGKTFSIQGDPTFIDIRACSNWVAWQGGQISAPFGSTNAIGGGVARYTCGPIINSWAGPAANTSYLTLADMWMTVTGGTGVSITLTPRYSTGATVVNVGSTFSGFIRRGTFINFGAYTAIPTVSASYAG